MELLSDKYRPTTLEDLVLTPKTKQLIESNINDKKYNHLLLCGQHGIGKTTLAKIIANSIGESQLYINASISSGVDVMREQVLTFVNAPAMDDNPKIVILDEADSLSRNTASNNAQSSLRNIIEMGQDDTVFILTANYRHKIIGPILSRCTPINLSFSLEDVTTRVCQILTQEDISFDMPTLQQFVDNVVEPNFPDMRTIVNALSLWTVSGELTNMGEVDSNCLEGLARKITNNPSPIDARKWYLMHETEFGGDYSKLGAAVFDVVKNPVKQIQIAEYLYRMEQVTDPEIQFFAMILMVNGK